MASDGNATVGESLHVSILNYDTKLSGHEIGNTLTVDPNHQSVRLDSTTVNFKWLADDTIQINLDHRLRTFIKEKKIQGVTIAYKTF